MGINLFDRYADRPQEEWVEVHGMSPDGPPAGVAHVWEAPPGRRGRTLSRRGQDSRRRRTATSAGYPSIAASRGSGAAGPVWTRPDDLFWR